MATVVAILLAGGVLLGFLSLVVDVGRIYVEREELQTGADAAALAVAKACATAATACRTDDGLLDLAQSYADANSGDGVSKVSGVCGRSAAALPACDPPAGNLTDCLGGEPPDGPFVEVRVSTEVAQRQPRPAPDLRPDHGRELRLRRRGESAPAPGRPGRARRRPRSSGWRSPRCEWFDLTGGSAGSEDDPQPADERTISIEPGHATCSGTTPLTDGWRRPGPAVWLDTDASCEVHLPLNKVLPGDPGAATGACEDRLRTAAANHETIYLPVYDARRGGNGGGQSFRILAFAPFLPTGFVLGAGAPGDGPVLASTLNPPDPPCPVNTTERCVSGVFTDPLVPVSTLAGDALVKLIG